MIRNFTRIPTVSFVYLTIPHMEYICNQYADMPLDKLKEALSKYSSLNDPKDEDFVELVSMGHFLYDDIELNKNEEFTEVYNQLVENHGQEFMDLVVTKDTDSIKSNILEFIDFVMTKLYHKSTIRVSFIDTNDNLETKSDYPNLIYSCIQEHFNIKEQCFYYGVKIITIEKRREDNVNNAD